jgi:uncharacterized integral membrane protein
MLSRMSSDEPERRPTPASSWPTGGRPATEPDAGDRARTEQEQRLRRARQGRVAKLVAVLAVVVILIIFIVANSQPVSVDYVFVDGHPRLIWVMLACAVLGGIIGFAVGRPGKELRRKPKQEPRRARDT